MDNETRLHDEIAREMEKLKEMEVGTDEYEATINGITKLYDRAIKIDEVNIDHEYNNKTRNDEKKDRIIKNVIQIAGIVIPTLVTIWGTRASFKFEQEGTITTIMGRGFINKLLPRK